jgi:hypothetical protein
MWIDLERAFLEVAYYIRSVQGEDTVHDVENISGKYDKEYDITRHDALAFEELRRSASPPN